MEQGRGFRNRARCTNRKRRRISKRSVIFVSRSAQPYRRFAEFRTSADASFGGNVFRLDQCATRYQSLVLRAFFPLDVPGLIAPVLTELPYESAYDGYLYRDGLCQYGGVRRELTDEYLPRIQFRGLNAQRNWLVPIDRRIFPIEITKAPEFRGFYLPQPISLLLCGVTIRHRGFSRPIRWW